MTYDAAHRERLVLERTMAAVRQGTLDPSALSTIPSVRTDAELQAALRDLADRETKLTAARKEFTDAHPTVREIWVVAKSRCASARWTKRRSPVAR